MMIIDNFINIKKPRKLKSFKNSILYHSILGSLKVFKFFASYFIFGFETENFLKVEILKA